MASWPSESVYDWTGNGRYSMLLRDCFNHLLVDCAGSKEAVASGELNPGTARQSGVLIPTSTAGGRALIPKTAFGWPSLAREFVVKDGDGRLLGFGANL